MTGATVGFEFVFFGGNFRKSGALTSGRWHSLFSTYFALRSLSARVGPNEIPRRFSSLPLFFASGRFATFLFIGDRSARRGGLA